MISLKSSSAPRAGIGRLTRLGLGLAFLFGATPPADANTVSGIIRYQNKLYNRSVGLTGGTELLPVRQADVEVVEGTTVLGTGVTDNTGAYAIAIPDGGTKTIFVRVYARRTTTNIQAVIKTDTSATSATYSAVSPAAGLDTNAAQTVSLDITGATVAGAYNIFDVAVLNFQFLDGLRPLNNPPLLTIYWKSGSSQGTFFDPDTHSIFLLGSTSDPDEFDDDILGHEIGHYVAAQFSKDDSPGGPHTVTSHVDIRLSWSEGWGHFWSAALRKWANENPAIAPQGASGPRYPEFIWQVDTNAGGFTAFEVSTPSFAAQAFGADNELSVAAVLWDAAVDALAAGNGPIWTVTSRFPTRLQISLEDFFDEWQAPVNGLPDLAPVLAAHTVRYVADALEPNNTSSSPVGLDPLDPSGTAKIVPTNTFFPLGDEDWFSFTALANGTYQIETVNLGDGADTTIEIFDPALTSVAFNDDRGSGDVSSLVQFKAAVGGLYRVKIAPYAAVGQVVTYGSYDLKITVKTIGGGNAPIVILDALPKSGDAPLGVEFSVTASSSGSAIDLYEWDFEGDGVVDFRDAAGGTVHRAYTTPGSYTATVRVSAETGAFTVATVLIVVSAPDAPTLAPAYSFTTPGATTAPAGVDFSAAVTGVTPRLFEWDFDNDAVFDYLSDATAAVSHVYTAAGSYTAVLRVTDDRGRTFTATTAGDKPIVIGAPASTPVTTLSTSPNPASGTLPLPVTFTATAGFARYEWDFEGDRRYDRVTTANTASFLYTLVGTYAPSVRVTNAGNLTATAAGAVAVTASGAGGWVVWPRSGQTLAGSAVTVVAEAVPAGVAKTVQFQFRQGAGAWQDLGSPQTGSGTRFTTTWDTSGFADPTAGLSLQITVNGAASAAAEVTGLAVSAAAPTISEGTNAGGQRTAALAVDATAAAAVFFNDGVSLFFPLGALSAAPAATLQADATNPSLATNGAAAGLVQFGPVYDLRLAAPAPSINGRFRIRLYFPDADGDGIVDGTVLNERSLTILWFDPALAGWRRDLPSDVNADGNWVETETWHFTQFGIFGQAFFGADSGGGGGHCFAGAAGQDGLAHGTRGTPAAGAPAATWAGGAGILLAATLLISAAVARRR